ncbi:hypothetical protein D3C81_2030280 [compost metagenome]
MKVELSGDQLEWIKQDLNTSIKSYVIGFSLMLISIFTLLYDKEYKDIAIVLLALGIAKVLYK